MSYKSYGGSSSGGGSGGGKSLGELFGNKSPEVCNYQPT